MNTKKFARHLLGMLVSVIAFQTARGQEPERKLPMEFPIRMVGGRTLLRGELVNGSRRVRTHLLLEIGQPFGIRLHSTIAASLDLTGPADIRFEVREGVALEGLAEPARLPLLEALTATYAQELEEVPISGVLGYQFLKSLRVELDYQRSRLTVSEPTEADPASAPPFEGADPTAGQGVLPVKAVETLALELGSGAPRFRVEVKGPRRVLAAPLTGDPDTWIDAGLAETLGRPGGDLDSARVGNVDVAKAVALRPRDDEAPFEDAPAILLGVNFLAHFVVTIDPGAGVATLRAWRTPIFPKADQAAFLAMAQGQADLLETWCAQNPEHRLSEDVAIDLIRKRLDSPKRDEAALRKALTFFADATPERRRTVTLLDFLATCRKRYPDAYALIRGNCLDLALLASDRDNDVEANAKTRSEIGAFLMEEGPEKHQEAYGHLLSAAFQRPRDGMINVRLARLYEAMGKTERAFSRYLQASITEEGAPLGIAGLNRLAKAMNAPMDVDTLERALEGRAPVFEPGSTHESRPEAAPSRRVLVEVFTGAHLENAAAVQLAADGLLAHFGSGEVALLQHHVPAPRPDPMTSRASLSRARDLEVQQVPQVILDGQPTEPVRGRPNHAGSVFRVLRDAVTERLKVPSEWKLAVHGSLSGTTLVLEFEVVGPARDGLSLQAYVAERTVLCPGESKIVFHRYVTRSVVFEEPKRLPKDVQTYKLEGRVRLTDVEESLDEVLDSLESEMESPFPLRPTRIVPGQLAIVAVLSAQGDVLQSSLFEVAPKERDR